MKSKACRAERIISVLENRISSDWAAFVVNGDASESSMWAWLWVIAGVVGLLGVVGETQVTVTQGK